MLVDECAEVSLKSRMVVQFSNQITHAFEYEPFWAVEYGQQVVEKMKGSIAYFLNRPF